MALEIGVYIAKDLNFKNDVTGVSHQLELLKNESNTLITNSTARKEVDSIIDNNIAVFAIAGTIFVGPPITQNVTVPVITSPLNGATVGSNPTISGTSNSSAIITIFVDGTSIGYTTADSSGSWSFSASGISSDPHILTAQASLNGVQSLISAPVKINPSGIPLWLIVLLVVVLAVVIAILITLSIKKRKKRVQPSI